MKNMRFKGQIGYWTVPGLLEPSAQDRMNNIIELVCEKTGLTRRELMAKDRSRRVVEARQICMYMIRKYTNMTLTAIGRAFNRDHTTIIHACEQINYLLEVDKNTVEKVHYLDIIIENSRYTFTEPQPNKG